MVHARVFLIFSLGFLVSCLFRGVNLAVAPHLVTTFELSAADLGFLTSIYFAAFVACQIPLGMLLDRYGPRRIEFWLLLCAAAGSLLFGCANSKLMLMIGRLFIGLGVSACLMAAIKAVVIWFPQEQFSTLNGGIFAIGGLGSIAAAAPFQLALTLVDWRSAFMALAVASLVVAFLIRFAVPERQTAQRDLDVGAQLRGLGAVLTSRIFWRVAPLTMLSQGMFLAVQGLWAGPYLRDVQGADDFAAAKAVSLLGTGMVAGYCMLGIAARILSRRGIPLVTTAGAAMLGFVMMQAVIVAQVIIPWVIVWLLYGFFGSSSAICYAVLGASFPAHMAGRASTALTLAVFASAFAIQSAIGMLVGWWPATATGYAAEGHETAWLAMLAAQILAFAWYCTPARGPSVETSIRERHRAVVMLNSVVKPRATRELESYTENEKRGHSLRLSLRSWPSWERSGEEEAIDDQETNRTIRNKHASAALSSDLP